MLATRDGLVAQNPTNLLDTHYLYYLPFCHVFASDDRLHLRLAPLLLREGQLLVRGAELKQDLSRLYEYYVGLTAEQREMLSFALSSRPPPHKESVVHQVYEKLLERWRPGKGNEASPLDATQRREAMRWVEQMYIDVEGSSYFEPSAGGGANGGIR